MGGLMRESQKSLQNIFFKSETTTGVVRALIRNEDSDFNRPSRRS